MKNQLIIGCILLFSSSIQAKQAEQYLYVTGGGGYHNLSYSLQNGTEKGQAGMTLNAGYSYFFNLHWGLQTGLGIQSFNAQSTVNFLSATPAVDTDGESYEFRANYKNWQEKQQVLSLDIPVTVQYRHAVNKKFGLLGSLGAEISFPVSERYETVGGEIVTTGFYGQYNAKLRNLPQHGFLTYTPGYKGNLSLKTACLGVAGLGGLIQLSEKVDLYVGGYFNYGLNNVLKADSKLLLQPDGTYDGVLASAQTSKVVPLSAGLKVGLYWRLPKARRPLKVEELPVMNPPADTLQKMEPAKAEIIKATDSVTVTPPQKAEVPAIVIVEPPVQPAVQPRDTVRPEDPFEKAKRIAATIKANFQLKSDQSGSSENDKIKELSDILKANPDICLHIVGHTCNTGTHEINVKYGMKRAFNMKQKFLAQGVPGAQLTTESKAYDEPLVPNTSDENRAKNRRVEIKVFRKNN